jgi:hypothetical protein
MATVYRGAPFAVRREKLKSPEEGLNPSMLNTQVSSISCAPFEPPHMVSGKRLMGRALKGSCPIQWVWKQGKPALRFCHAHGKAGRIIPVRDAVDALEKSRKLCAEWNAKKGTLRERKDGGQYQILAADMSEGPSLRKYALGRVKSKKRRSR